MGDEDARAGSMNNARVHNPRKCKVRNFQARLLVYIRWIVCARVCLYVHVARLVAVLQQKPVVNCKKGEP